MRLKPSSLKILKYFQVFILSAGLLLSWGCSDKTESNLVKKSNPCGAASCPQKPGVKAQTGELLAIGLMASSFTDQILRRELGLGLQNEIFERCITQKNEQSTNTLLLDLKGCGGSDQEFVGLIKIVKAKDAEGVIKKIEITHASDSGNSPLRMRSISKNFENITELEIGITLNRLNAYTFGFTENVKIKSTRSPEKLLKRYSVFLQAVQREGFVQVFAQGQPSLIVYTNNSLVSEMFNESSGKTKKFTSTVNFTTESSTETRGHYVVCGQAQGQQKFINEVDDNGEKIDLNSAIVITQSELHDQGSGRKTKLNGLCGGLISERLQNMDKLIDQRLDKYFGNLNANGSADPNARGRQVRNGTGSSTPNGTARPNPVSK